VLVAVQKPAGMGADRVAVKGAEADMDIVVAVMDHAW